MESSSPLMVFLAEKAPVFLQAPWAFVRLTRPGWCELIARLDTTPAWALLALWAEPKDVHAALYDEESGAFALVALACPEGSFPSFSGARPGAVRFERAIQDLVGLRAEGLEDQRPWLDHGQFPVRHPLAASPEDQPPVPRAATDYAFLPTQSNVVLHQIPVGPVHAGIIEPGHFRFHANGETVVRLEARLGYVHKGVEKLFEGKTPAEGARLACRISGDSAVAHAVAFARSVESAVGVEAPPRAHALRGIMAEVERIANHLGDVGAIGNDAAFAFLLAVCGVERERTLEVAGACFGHRLMMDTVVPGGVTVDLAPESIERLRAWAARLSHEAPRLESLYDSTSSLLERTMTTGVVSAALVHRFAAGGYVGRASARGFDARTAAPYPPYTDLDVTVPVFSEGDVDARMRVRLREIPASLNLITALLDSLPEGPTGVPLPTRAGEGVALVEGFRGEILTWTRLGADGRIKRCHPRDPSGLQWPLLEAAIEGNIVADFPLCNKSFNGSYSGHDL